MVAMTVLLCTSKVLQLVHYPSKLLADLSQTREVERQTYHAHTQYSSGVPSYRLPPSKWCRASL